MEYAGIEWSGGWLMRVGETCWNLISGGDDTIDWLAL